MPFFFFFERCFVNLHAKYSRHFLYRPAGEVSGPVCGSRGGPGLCQVFSGGLEQKVGWRSGDLGVSAFGNLGSKLDQGAIGPWSIRLWLGFTSVSKRNISIIFECLSINSVIFGISVMVMLEEKWFKLDELKNLVLFLFYNGTPPHTSPPPSQTGWDCQKGATTRVENHLQREGNQETSCWGGGGIRWNFMFAVLFSCPPSTPSICLSFWTRGCRSDWPRLCLFCCYQPLVCCQPTELIWGGLFVWSFRLFGSWLVPLRQHSSSKFPLFYSPPPPEICQWVWGEGEGHGGRNPGPETEDSGRRS